MKHTTRNVLKIITFLMASLIMFSCKSIAKEGHQIHIHIKGIQDTETYLAYHFGNRQYLKDTTYVDQEGYTVFEGPERLTPGLYLVVLDDHSNFEVLIDRNQHFSIHIDPDDFVGTARFEGSLQNKAFYDYLNFLSEKNKERQELDQELRDMGLSPARHQEVREAIEAMDKTVREKQDHIINRYPDALLAHILLAQRDPELPDPPTRPDGQRDTDAMYQIYKEKFFDNIDFSDERLLHTPVYHNRLRIYFNNVLIQHPDSIIREADRVLDKSRANREMFKYTVWFITNNAESSQMMGMDKLYVHMLENYYLSGEVDWIEKDRLERLKQRLEEMKPLLMGEVAPNISIYDPDGEPVVLHDIEAEYLVLYFWDSECVFCREATPKLKEAYNQLRDRGVQVFAVNTEKDTGKWLQAIANYPQDWIHGHDIHNKSEFRDKYAIYAIPMIFILDSEKRILAKGIGAEYVAQFLRQEMSVR